LTSHVASLFSPYTGSLHRKRGCDALAYGQSLLHLPLNLISPALASLGHGLSARHAGEVGHVAKAGVRGCGWSEAVIPFALGVAD